MTTARTRPRVTTTHTYAILDISEAAFDEIRDKLKAADYGHAFHQDGDGHLVLDMHGIAVRKERGEVEFVTMPHVSPAALGGPWTAKDHAAHPSFDEPLARELVAMFEPYGGWSTEDGVGYRATDWGGGIGLYLDALRDAGAWTYLVEPHLSIPVDRGHLVAALDMARPNKRIPWGASHLSLCLEVLEHIPRDRHPAALGNVCRAVAPGGWLVFSAATPGQGGYGHVAERPESEWREELRARGLVEDAEKTAALRAVATLPWFKANLMCWQRPAEGGMGNDGN